MMAGGGGDQIDPPLEKTTLKKPSLIRVKRNSSSTGFGSLLGYKHFNDRNFICKIRL